MTGRHKEGGGEEWKVGVRRTSCCSVGERHSLMKPLEAVLVTPASVAKWLDFPTIDFRIFLIVSIDYIGFLR